MRTSHTPFADQCRLFEAVGPDAEIDEALELGGLSIDDLVYENSRTLKWEGAFPDALAYDQLANGVPVASFFSGCGGMDLGFETVGYEHLASFEISETFCNTLRLNRPNWRIFGPPCP